MGSCLFDSVPSEELGRVPGGDSAAVLAVPTGAPRGLYEGHHYFMPRVGFAYSPFDDNKTSIRGGFGMYYDRIEGNLIFPSLSNPPCRRARSSKREPEQHHRRFDNGGAVCSDQCGESGSRHALHDELQP